MEDERRRSGVQSIEVGSGLLRALTDADGPLSLSTLARAADMSTAKAHRYLVSYVLAGLVSQNERSGSYDLGPLAVRMGLTAIERFDAVRAAGERLGTLRDEIDRTILLSVWTDAGPTVARIELSRHPVTLAVRVGTAFPLRTSATGQIFLAFAPDLAATIEPHEDAEAAALRARVLRDGASFVDETFLVGVAAIATPLFHANRKLAAVTTAIGRPGELDPSPKGPLRRALQAFATSLEAGRP
jgi:DNA-binding IclR family transcriptional regulator